MAIKSWSTTAADNDDADATINWLENQAPSTVNNSARAMMAAVRTWYEDVEWRDLGDTVTYASATTFTISGNVTARYVANRPIRCTDSSTLYGIVASSSYSAPNTTVTVTLDSGSLSASLTAVSLGVTPSTQAIPIQAVRNGAAAFLAANNTFSGNNDFTGVNSGLVIPCQGRLTLTTATPVTTADVTAATTLYFTPYKGNKVALYDGTSKWKVYGISELSIAVPATTDTMYDVFVYDNSGTPTLELTAWTNDTTRATALTTQNGVLVKTGATTRVYVGSFRTTGVSGQTEDSVAKRYVWNYYNRVIRKMKVSEGTDSWTYTTATFRQANGSTANQLDMVIGVSEDLVSAHVIANANNSTVGIDYTVGIGVDSTSSLSADCVNTRFQVSATGSRPSPVSAFYKGYPGAGRHYLAWLEYSVASGTTTWYGDAGGTLYYSGIQGEILG